MRSFRTTLRLASVAVVAGLWAFAPGAAPRSAAAAVTTWTGGAGTGSWSDASNWTTQPTTTGTWGLVFDGNTQVTSTNTIGTITVDSLAFTNDGTAGRTFVYSLSGSPLALSSAAVTTTAVTGSALAIAGDTVGTPLTVTGANTFTLGSGHSLSLAGDIGGTGSIVYGITGGTPKVYVTGSNSYAGGTTITGGQVRTGAASGADSFNNNAFGTGQVVVSGSGSIAIRNASTVSNALSISGTGDGQGALRGSFSTSDRTATVSGSVALGGDASIVTAASSALTGNNLLFTGPIDLGGNTLTLLPGISSGGGSVPIELAGGVRGTGAVVVDAGSSSVVFSGSSSYSGGTTVSSGTARVGHASALGSGRVALNAGVLDLNGQALTIGTLSGSTGALITSTVAGPASLTTNMSSSATYDGSITDGAGVVSLTKQGTGILYMTGSNSYSGTTLVTAGQVRTGDLNGVDSSNNNAFGTSQVVVSGSGTVAVRNGTSLANNFTISGNGAEKSGVDQGAIRGSFSSSGRTATLSGTVTLGGHALIATAASTGITGNKLVLAGPVDLGANVLTFAPGISGSSSISVRVDGAIGGTGGVVVDGPGAVFLNGTNSYSGATTVKAGTLGGNGTGLSAVTVQSGATIAPGSDEGLIGTLGVGSLQLDSGATAAMSISGTAAGTFDQITAMSSVAYGGALAIDFQNNGFATGSLWQLFAAASHSGHFSSVTATGAYGDLIFNYLGDGEWKATGGSLADGQSLSFYETDAKALGGRYLAGQLVVVPEPTAMAIAASGAALMGVRRWKRRSRRTVGRGIRQGA